MTPKEAFELGVEKVRRNREMSEEMEKMQCRASNKELWIYLGIDEVGTDDEKNRRDDSFLV